MSGTEQKEAGKEAFVYEHRIKYYETDKMGLTHHSNYIRFMEEARVELLRSWGLNWAALEEEGILSAVTAVQGSFKNVSRFDDTLRIRVFLREYTGIRMVFGYEMEKEDGQTVFEGTSEHCFLNPEGRPLRLKKLRPELHELLLSKIE
ncbi:MAG: acyl-CoA thioesterase [Lachnospiraceae bacterium]|nr:acyl-CoA thioesterase [Lachnospiraceae bacterium]